MSVIPNFTNANATTSFFTLNGSGGGGGGIPLNLSTNTITASTITVQALTTSTINGGAYPPAASSGMNLIFWADQTNTSANGTLAVVSQYSNVIINNGITINSNGTNDASLTLPTTGSYMIDVQGWICGSGTGLTRVNGIRSGSNVYDRYRGWDVNCAIGFARYVWNGFQAGDILQIHKNQNNGGNYTANVDIDLQADEWGPIAIYRLA